VLKNSIESGLMQLGANTYQLQKVSMDFNTTPEQRRRMRNRKDITLAQGMLVKERSTLAETIGFEVSEGGRVVVREGMKTNPNVPVLGESLEGIVTNDWTVVQGRGLTAEDIALARPVVILGSAVLEKLFLPHENPIGTTVRIDNTIYQVIGTFAKKGGMLGGNQDNFVVVPLTTFFQRFGQAGRSIRIMVTAKSGVPLDDSIEESRTILRMARKLTPGADDDFAYFSNDSLIKQFNDFTFYLRLGVLVVSSIALVAAGVGIMNIMLVSVTERTREIGIRKAIGARRRDILAQFMIEAIILCEIGGAVGILLGVLGGNVVGLLVEAPAVIPWDWAGIGAGACTGVGLGFGVYPAWKASMLDPVEALRYE
jgi:putative ABC transport system permease protein